MYAEAVHKASLLLVAALLADQPGGPTVLIDNAYVHVVDTVGQPRATARNVKNADRVLVYLTGCDGRKPGDVAWNPAMPSAGNRCRVIEIQLKPGSGRVAVAAGPLDPVKVDPAHYKVELENDRVRVMRARYGPVETGAVHQHDRDRVTVFLTPSELRITDPDGKREALKKKQFDVSWGTVSRHGETNLSREPFEVIAVEMKWR